MQRCFLGARARTEKSQHGRAGFATSCRPSCVNVRGHCSSSGSYKRALCDNLQVLPDTGAQKPASHSARLVNPVAAALQRLIEANKTKLRHSWVTPQPAPPGTHQHRSPHADMRDAAVWAHNFNKLQGRSLCSASVPASHMRPCACDHSRDQLCRCADGPHRPTKPLTNPTPTTATRRIGVSRAATKIGGRRDGARRQRRTATLFDRTWFVQAPYTLAAGTRSIWSLKPGFDAYKDARD